MDNLRNQAEFSDRLKEISKRYESLAAKALLEEDWDFKHKMQDIPNLLKMVHQLHEEKLAMTARLAQINVALTELVNGV